MNDQVKVVLRSYQCAAVKATESLLRNWIVIPASIGAGGIFLILAHFFGGAGIMGGFLLGMTQIVLISLYCCWLKSSLDQERLSWGDLIALDGSVFSAVINTAFLLFLVKFFISTLVQGTGMEWIVLMVQFGIVILLNPLPEVVYYRRSEGMEAIQEAFEFTKKNWLEWFLPFVVLLLPWIVMAPGALLGVLARMEEMLPALVLVYSFQSLAFLLPIDGMLRLLVGTLLGIIAMNWFMMFRGFLFKEMDESTLRARAFKSRMQ